MFVCRLVVVVWPLPNITVVSAPVERGKLWFSTVLWRRSIASAPLSKRAEVAALAALNDDGAGATNQEVLSRLSLETPLLVSSSTKLAAIAFANFFALPLVMVPRGALGGGACPDCWGVVLDFPRR